MPSFLNSHVCCYVNLKNLHIFIILTCDLLNIESKSRGKFFLLIQLEGKIGDSTYGNKYLNRKNWIFKFSVLLLLRVNYSACLNLPYL